MMDARWSRALSWVQTGGGVLLVVAEPWMPKREVGGGPEASAARTFDHDNKIGKRK